jgi:hypothetical protein
MVENEFKSQATDLLSMAFEIQKSALQMQNICLGLLLGSSGSSTFIDDYRRVLENCQSRGVQRNRRSYDQLNFEVFNMTPTLYIDFFNEMSRLYAPKKIL